MGDQHLTITHSEQEDWFDHTGQWTNDNKDGESWCKKLLHNLSKTCIYAKYLPINLWSMLYLSQNL